MNWASSPLESRGGSNDKMEGIYRQEDEAVSHEQKKRQDCFKPGHLFGDKEEAKLYYRQITSHVLTWKFQINC